MPFYFPTNSGLKPSLSDFPPDAKQSQLTSPCYSVRGKVENSSILNRSCETHPAWVLVTWLTLSQWRVKRTGWTGALQTTWPTLHWRKGHCPRKYICSVELKVRTTDKKNSGLSERHFHVYMCEGPFSWNLNSLYPTSVSLLHGSTDISLTFGAVASWYRIVREKASLF